MAKKQTVFNPDAKRHSTKSLIDHYGLKSEVIDVLRISLTSARKCAKEDKREIDLTLPFLCQLWIDQEGRCAISNVPMSTKTGSHKYRNNLRSSVDRIDSELGYTKDNVRLLCWQNNNGIGAGSDQEYINMCSAVYFHQLKKQINESGLSVILPSHIGKVFDSLKESDRT